MLKYASLAVAVAARNNLSCADTKQWADCVLAYANGECGSNIGECDRTCGRCGAHNNGEDICYDMIPQAHTYFYDLAMPVRSQWPTSQNDGGNSLPRKLEEEQDSLYPFDQANVSKFCLDIFESRLCEESDLHLTYDAGQTYEKKITLAGKAYEYCRFTCGYCKQTTDCYNNHNEGMKYLSAPLQQQIQEIDLGGWDLNSFGGFDSFDSDDTESDSDDGGWGSDWGSDSGSDWGSDGGSDWGADAGGWGDDSWAWRKKRAVDIPKAELLKSAVSNIVSHLTHEINPKMMPMAANLTRKRRQSYMLGQAAEEYEERKRFTDMIGICWGNVANDDVAFGEEIEEEEEEEGYGAEEEEGEGNYIDQITERRADLDNVGINLYFDNLNNEASMGACSYFPMPYSEPDMYMSLHYVCDLSCPEGKSAFAYNSVTETVDEVEEYKMECERKHKGMKPKEPSDCASMQYPNLRIICQDVEEEEPEENIYQTTDEESENLEDELANYYDNMFMFY